MLLHYDLSVIAMIGVILLIGIVKKNAIMMIDFALQAERIEGKSPREAIHQACLLRFRPIMMTTFAALFGGLPIALGQGAGSELRRPLGIAIVGGLARVAMADPLHDADHLSLSRTLCALGRPPVSAVAHGGRPGRRGPVRCCATERQGRSESTPPHPQQSCIEMRAWRRILKHCYQ